MEILKYGNVYCDTDTNNFYVINKDGYIGKHPTEKSILPEPRFVYYKDKMYVVLLSNDGVHNAVFGVDNLMACTFLQNDIDKVSFITIDKTKHFIIEHLDGDQKNNSISNLKLKTFMEEWKNITYPGVYPNTYKVSNFGNIYNYKKEHICKLHNGLSHVSGKAYKRVSLYSTDNKFHEYRVHRLVVREFLDHGFPDRFNSEIEVNHIDGNTSNNRIDNLEICNPVDNNKHSYLMGLAHNRGADHYASIFSEQRVRDICRLLVEYNGASSKVLKRLHELGHTEIRRSNVNKIKQKISWKHISDDYFDDNTFVNMSNGSSHYNAKISEDLVRQICSLLVRFNGDGKAVSESLRQQGIYNITTNDISDIKRKQRWVSVTDEYFEYKNKIFIPKIIK